jgi:hypothetical protein
MLLSSLWRTPSAAAAADDADAADAAEVTPTRDGFETQAPVAAPA